jgi:hypothetical protein
MTRNMHEHFVICIVKQVGSEIYACWKVTRKMYNVKRVHVVNDDEKCSVEYPNQFRDLQGR